MLWVCEQTCMCVVQITQTLVHLFTNINWHTNPHTCAHMAVIMLVSDLFWFLCLNKFSHQIVTSLRHHNNNALHHVLLITSWESWIDINVSLFPTQLSSSLKIRPSLFNMYRVFFIGCVMDEVQLQTEHYTVLIYWTVPALSTSTVLPLPGASSSHEFTTKHASEYLGGGV